MYINNYLQKSPDISHPALHPILASPNRYPLASLLPLSTSTLINNGIALQIIPTKKKNA